MLEHFYKERRTLVDFRRGPLGPYFDGFAAYLKTRGYAHHHTKTILGRCCLFNTYLMDHGITNCRRVSRSLIEPFLNLYQPDTTRLSHYVMWMDTQRAVKHLFAYLVTVGVLTPDVPKPVVTSYSWVLEPYLTYLREEGERTEKTIQRIRGQLGPFLEGLGVTVTRQRLKGLKAETVEAAVKQHLGTSPDNLRRLASTLRGFLQFCAQRRYTATDFSGLIPRVPTYRLAALPRGLEESDLQRILARIDQASPAGCRDYAMMLLLMAYGIRGAQVAALMLEDICWPRSTIRIRASKGGKEVVLPLLASVGEAILRYFRHRPACPCRQVFLATHAPFRPVTGLVISRRVREHFQEAGVTVPKGGSSTLRHSWAIRALAHDIPMKAIADVLGHRDLNTSFIYAKADLHTLRQVATPWPEEEVTP